MESRRAVSENRQMTVQCTKKITEPSFRPPRGPQMPSKKECPLKAGLRCSVLSAKRVTNGIVNTIRDGRCYEEMCHGVRNLVYNNPWDGFGSKAGYNPEEFSLRSTRMRDNPSIDFTETEYDDDRYLAEMTLKIFYEHKGR